MKLYNLRLALSASSFLCLAAVLVSFQVISFPAEAQAPLQLVITSQTISQAIAAAGSGGVVHLESGTYTPTSTVNITTPLTFECSSDGSTIIQPTAAVTGSAININPASAAQVIFRNCQIDMSNVPSIPAILVKNLAADSEIAWVQINRGSIGLDISNSSVSSFHDLYITNQSSFGIRDNGDGGAEHTYENVWLINNNNAVGTTALFELVRTTTDDTGGIYMHNVRAIQNGSGGTVTNGFLFTSSAGSRTTIFGDLFETVCDGITGGDCVQFNNVQRVRVVGGQWGSAKSNQSCAAATVNCYAAMNLVSAGQIDATGATFSSANRDVSLSGTVDQITLTGNQMFGSAATGAAHVWVVTGATLSNFLIWNNPYDSTTNWSNNESGLIAGSRLYSNAGNIGFGDGLVGTPSLFFANNANTGFYRPASNTIGVSSNGNNVAKFDTNGITALNFISQSVNSASTGSLRLSSTDGIYFRNNVNSADIQLGKNASDQLTFKSQVVSDGSHANTLTIASGTAALGTGSISSNSCAAAITVGASVTATTDVIAWSFNADPSGVVGYGSGTTGTLSIWAYPTANNVNFRVCNLTSGAITPGAATLNWGVVR
jgi:hypothetical protein